MLFRVKIELEVMKGNFENKLEEKKDRKQRIRDRIREYSKVVEYLK